MHTFVLFNVYTYMEMKGNKSISVKQILHGRKYSAGLVAVQIYPQMFAPGGVQSTLVMVKVVVKEVEVEMEVVVIQ